MFFEPKRIEKPWGFEVWFAQTDVYVGKLIHVNAHAQLSLQYHEKKDETMYCLNGDAILVFEKDDVLVEEVFRQGRSFRIVPGTKHRLKAGDHDCEILEVSTSEVEDVIRLKDDYGRTK
ncbi:MAG: cupin [Patescibacteria group bacterium]